MIGPARLGPEGWVELGEVSSKIDPLKRLMPLNQLEFWYQDAISCNQWLLTWIELNRLEYGGSASKLEGRQTNDWCQSSCRRT